MKHKDTQPDQPRRPQSALSQFESESGATRVAFVGAPDLLGLVRSQKVVSGAVLSIAVIGAAIGIWFRSTASGAEAPSGMLRVESDPQDANVTIDGTARGMTPLSVVISPGKHQLLLQRGDQKRALSIDIAPNVATVHHITWPSEQLRTPEVGNLRVVSEAAAMTVTVDKVQRGSTPVTIRDLSVGDHQVVVQGKGTVYRRTIRVEPGTTASLVVGGSNQEAQLASGWLSATTATPLQILENGKLVGSTESERIMLPAGEHAFEFVNQSLGFSVARTLKISPGGTTTVAIDLPRVPISVNALPWAQVWLDGEALGQTPIGNLATTIGTHELILRHPQLGERRITAVATLKEPARVAIDMRKPQ